MRSRRVLAAALVAAGLVACSSGAQHTASRPSPTPSATPSSTPSAAPSRTAAPSPSATASPRTPLPGSPTAPAAALPSKVLVVVLENHSQDQAWSRMPFLRGLGLRYGYASDYTGVAHPSLPNYLAIAGGSTFGVHDDAGPSSHRLSGASVFGQALAAGRSAKVYAEAMPAPCGASSTSRYAVKHDPWPYFRDSAEQAGCSRYAVPAGTADSGPFAADVAADTLPTVGLLVPDICHDGHDCSLSVTDDWLRQWLSPVLAGADVRTGRLAVVVTFDEDDYSSGNRVLTVVVAAQLHGTVVRRQLSHLSLSRWLSQLSGSPGLRDAAQAPSLGAAFGLAR